jgi:hypothetical protein
VKKASGISILLLLFYTQMGYYGQFIVLQWRMKEAARKARIAALPDSVFVRISLKEMNRDGRWEEPGKECWYKGHLYDVMRQKTLNGDCWLFCMDDEGEERLIHGAEKFTGASQDTPDKKTGHTLTITIGDMVCDTTAWSIAAPAISITRHSIADTHHLPARYAEIVIPPPKSPPVLFG